MTMYESKAKTTKISYTSRASVKIHENFYTVEATEERSIPDVDDVNMAEEWKLLCSAVDAIVDNQCEEIVRTFSVK